MPGQYDKRRDEASPKKLFSHLRFGEPDTIPALGLAGANSYTVPHAAGGIARKKDAVNGYTEFCKSLMCNPIFE